MRSSRKRLVTAFVAGIGLSVFLIVLEYRIAGLSLWINIPEMPGFIVAMFTVGVHGSMKPFHIVMGAINALFYALVAFSVMNWIARLRNQ